MIIRDGELEEKGLLESDQSDQDASSESCENLFCSVRIVCARSALTPASQAAAHVHRGKEPHVLSALEAAALAVCAALTLL